MKKEQIRVSEDKRENIKAFRFNDSKTDCCDILRSSKGQSFVLDLDDDGKICGIEIFDYRKNNGK